MKYILYTEEEGGDFHTIACHTDEETQKLFDSTVKNKFLIHATGDGGRIIKIRPAYIALVGTVSDFDFVTGKPRKYTGWRDPLTGQKFPSVKEKDD